MQKSELEYEDIIKGLIDANIYRFQWLGMQRNAIAMNLKYKDIQLDVTLSDKTDRQVFVDYFYNKVMNSDN